MPSTNGTVGMNVFGMITFVLPVRIEEDNEFLSAAITAMCKSSKEASEEFRMAITIIVIALSLRPGDSGERGCQCGPASQGQKNVGGGGNTHYYGRRNRKNVLLSLRGG